MRAARRRSETLSFAEARDAVTLDDDTAGSSDRYRRSYDGAVAYDEDLADRIRDVLADEPDLTEKKMFGGLAFLIAGHMAVAASGRGGLMVRVDPDKGDDLMAKSNAQPMEMRGRAMSGWLRVDTDDVRQKRQLVTWVKRGVSYAKSLPPK
jgi:hypothetical protein